MTSPHGELQLVLQEGDQVAVAHVGAEPPHGLEVALLVELEAVGADGAVQVDGELGDAQQRPVDVDEAGGAVPQDDASGESQVAVEPGVHQRAAVDLDGDLPPAVRAAVGERLDPQVGGVGVGAEDAEGGVGGGALGDVPGDQRATAQHVTAAGAGGGRRRGLRVPGVRLGDLPESGLLQPLGGARHRVVRRRARRHEGHQVVGVAAVEAGGCAHGFTLTTAKGPLPGIRSGPW